MPSDASGQVRLRPQCGTRLAVLTGEGWRTRGITPKSAPRGLVELDTNTKLFIDLDLPLCTYV